MIVERNDLLAEVVDAWGTILGAPAGPDENFFRCGGTSLHAARLAEILREKTRRDVDLASVFNAPTPASLAEELATLSVLPAPRGTRS